MRKTNESQAHLNCSKCKWSDIKVKADYQHRGVGFCLVHKQQWIIEQHPEEDISEREWANSTYARYYV